MKKLTGNLVVLLILCELLVLFFNDVVFRNKTLKSSFTLAQTLVSGPYQYALMNLPLPYSIPYADNGAGVAEEPYQQFKRNAVLKGILPLWNPYQACGMPFLANGLTATLFPLTAFLYILPEKYSWDFYIIFLLLIAGLLTCWFMRLLGYSTLPSVTAAAAYMFTGPMMIWMANVTINTAVMLPLLFICVEKLIRAPGGKWIAISSFSVGLMMLSGHLERIFFAFFTAAVYFTLRVIFLDPETGIGRARIVKSAFMAFFLGLLLSAVFILPFTECWFNGATLHHSDVGMLSEENPARAMTILVPYFFQPVLTLFDYTRAGWLGGYLGIMVVLLALAGIFRKDSKKNNLIFGFMAFFIIMKCYGVWPVNYIGALPLFNKMRFSMHYTQDFAFVMAVLSGIGLQRFTESKNRFRALITLPALLIALLILGHVIYYSAKPSMGGGVTYAFLLLLTAAAGACFIKPRKMAAVFLAMLLAGELFYLMPRGRAPKYEAFAKVPYIEFIKKQDPYARVYGIGWGLFPNTATGYGMFDMGVYELVLTKRFVSYMRLLDIKFEEKTLSCVRGWLPNLSSPFLDLLGVKYIVDSVNEMEWRTRPDNLELAYSGEANVYRRKTAFPRAFITHKALFVKSISEAIELMKANSGKLRDIAFIEGDQKGAGIKDMPEAAPGKHSSRADIKKYTPNYVKIEAYSDSPGFLVLSDSWYPGWYVSVDGKRAKLLIADIMLRAVFLEKGKHAVEFYYRPFSVMLGACVSLLVFIFLVIISRKARKGGIGWEGR